MEHEEPLSPIEPIICLAHRLESIANKYVFGPLGFSAVSMKILKALKRHPALSPGNLIEITNSTKSNISQRLNFLEKEGYIKRSGASGGKDRRKVDIRLTASGKRKLTEIEKRFKKAHICLAQRFNREEISQHKIFMQKINTILNAEEDELKKLFKN